LAESFLFFFLFFNDFYDCPSFASASSSAAIVLCPFVFARLSVLFGVLPKYVLNTGWRS